MRVKIDLPAFLCGDFSPRCVDNARQFFHPAQLVRDKPSFTCEIFPGKTYHSLWHLQCHRSTFPVACGIAVTCLAASILSTTKWGSSHLMDHNFVKQPKQIDGGVIDPSCESV